MSKTFLVPRQLGAKRKFKVPMSAFFLLWLCVSAASDAIYRRIYNWILIFGGLAAIASISIFQKSHPVDIQLLDSFVGAVVAFSVLIFFYIAKMMGAGDVKFAAVLGLWVGWQLLLPIWALSCSFAVIHGFFSRSSLKFFFTATSSMSDGLAEGKRKFIPYVTYLSVATIIVMGFYKNQ